MQQRAAVCVEAVKLCQKMPLNAFEFFFNCLVPPHNNSSIIMIKLGILKCCIKKKSAVSHTWLVTVLSLDKPTQMNKQNIVFRLAYKTAECLLPRHQSTHSHPGLLSSPMFKLKKGFLAGHYFFFSLHEIWIRHFLKTKLSVDVCPAMSARIIVALSFWQHKTHTLVLAWHIYIILH